ncbi:hypothetical protein NDN08_008130 [Rhodosorus marinus]|uniref:cysteine--tRNA ligase n=1 Tax=Rhodosorus marinus TaxID=101924 RepID=A0AAV8V3G7_9RHOD|nr:hypothetical protein NDN08_008130 [Rhodosorus marinus]
MGETPLKLFNSFSKEKDVFKTVVPRQIGWYICGPTVYDSAHMGHARNYVNFDILRRVLTGYFGYSATYVMNVTDIDDKIILRTHLLRLKEVIDVARTANHQGDAFKAAEKTLIESEKDLVALKAAHEALAQEVNAPEFDVQTNFQRIARKYELEFFEDMKALGVRPPDVLTRVSEYVEEVKSFIDGVISKGYAYASNGSVYFDTQAFIKSTGKRYGKLEPGAVGNATLLAEGEGALTQDDEKRSPMDFVLWKSSKEGEPTWESQWGAGRPGWHVECSAMCSDILGCRVDINCGGVDLSFPHHENQLAQSEAYWDCSQWVNYFVHSGHLHIDGLKMSKSLKNFITINAAMSLYTARQIRFLFLLHLWSEPMDLTPTLKADGGGLEGFVQMEQAIAAESSFAEFFFMVKALNREAASNTETAETFWTEVEKNLHQELLQTQLKVDAALRDSVDTPVAVKTLLELVRSVNKYTTRNPEARVHLVLTIARYIGQILKVFGVGSSDDEIGFGSDRGEGRGVEEILTPHLDAFVQFRDEIRSLAKEKAEPKVFLSSCDNLRDVTLPKLGVVIGDSDASGTWKLYDQKELELMMERERQEKARNEEEKRRKQEEAELANRERDLKASILPSEFFRTGEYEGNFSTYDEAGIPLTDNQHNELTKSKRKNLTKIHTAHVKNHEKWKRRSAAQ